MAEEVVAVPHDTYIGYEVLRLHLSSSPNHDISLAPGMHSERVEPRFRLLAETGSDVNLGSIFAADSEYLERHAYEVDGGLQGEAEEDGDDSRPHIVTTIEPRKYHFALFSYGLLITTRELADLVDKPVFLAVREDASPYYVRDRVFRINVYNNTRLTKVSSLLKRESIR